MDYAVHKVKFKDKSTDFYYRADSVSDIALMNQILFGGEYYFSRHGQGQALLRYHLNDSRMSLIIDAGANIGAATVYFSAQLENTVVFSIEPDINNFNLLRANTANFNTINYFGAIASTDGLLQLDKPDEYDWSFRTSALNDNGNSISTSTIVNSISPNTILSIPQLSSTKPYIFKIDIEGAESELFSNNTEWINKFPCIIIEIHDFMLPFQGVSSNFFRAISKYDFDVLHYGENLFLFNRQILG